MSKLLDKLKQAERQRSLAGQPASPSGVEVEAQDAGSPSGGTPNAPADAESHAERELHQRKAAAETRRKADATAARLAALRTREAERATALAKAALLADENAAAQARAREEAEMQLEAALRARADAEDAARTAAIERVRAEQAADEAGRRVRAAAQPAARPEPRRWYGWYAAAATGAVLGVLALALRHEKPSEPVPSAPIQVSTPIQATPLPPALPDGEPLPLRIDADLDKFGTRVR